MSLLLHSEIVDLLDKSQDNPENALVITPLLDRKNQIGSHSVDVRLSNEFIVLKQRALPFLDPTNDNLISDVEMYQDRVRIDYHEQFVLHPQQLVLGATLEYISIPNNLVAEVLGRSSWGRLGLIIETAPVVAPGFKGCITLELANLGNIPLVLYPGMIIAQLIFSKGEGKGEYKGRYLCPTGPQFSRINKDASMKFWGRRPPYPDN